MFSFDNVQLCTIIDPMYSPIRRWHIGRQPMKTGHIGPIILDEIDSGFGEIVIKGCIRGIEWCYTNLLAILNNNAFRDMNKSQWLDECKPNQFAFGAIFGEHRSLTPHTIKRLNWLAAAVSLDEPQCEFFYEQCTNKNTFNISHERRNRQYGHIFNLIAIFLFLYLVNVKAIDYTSHTLTTF